MEEPIIQLFEDKKAGIAALRYFTEYSEDNGMPIYWFVAKDLKGVLNFGYTTEITTRVPSKYKKKVLIKGVSQRRPTMVVSEYGLYHLAIRARNAKANNFKRLLVARMLPTYMKVTEGSTESLISLVLFVLRRNRRKDHEEHKQ